MIVSVILDLLGRVFVVHQITLSLAIDSWHASLIDMVGSAIFVVLLAAILVRSILTVVVLDTDDIQILPRGSLLGEHVSVSW